MGVQQRLGSKKLTEKDVYFCYFSNTPAFEHMLFCLCLVYSIKIGFYSADLQLESLQQDLECLKPTFFPMLPNLLFKFYVKIQEKLKSEKGCKYWFIEKCCNTKLDYLDSGGYTYNMMIDSLIFNRIKSTLGGKCRLMMTTGAPISAEILKFMKICFCLDICEAYGSMESGAIATLSAIGDNRTGEQGGPLNNIKLKLKDSPDLNFLTTNDPPQGEIYLQGPGIATSYFKNEELTASSFDENGWFKTGDIGELGPNGSLRIISKANQVYNLKTDKQIIPCKLEQLFVQSEFISQALVYGDSEKEYIIALIVVSSNLVPESEETEFDENLKKQIFEDIMRICDQFKL